MGKGDAVREYLLEMFAVSLTLTIAVELAVALLLSALRGKKAILLVILVNVLTNPPAVLLCWLGRLYLPKAAYLPVQMIVEIAVAAVEAMVYYSFSKKAQWKIEHPVMLSVIANLCAWLTGIVILAVRG